MAWSRTLLGSLVLACSLLVGCLDSGDATSQPAYRSEENRLGTRFTPVRSYDFVAPRVSEVSMQPALAGDTIWGAIGRDDRGHLYFGTSVRVGAEASAHLYRYDPGTRILESQGDVVSQLKRHGLYRPGLGQNKLHSKFYQADDGYVYFSSFDEQGEDAQNNPTWGGHLWRKLPEAQEWEHLLAAPEALVAVNSYGNYVYTLGYWGHVLYQYDTLTGVISRVEVGSVPGHVSRNFLVDLNGHAYVPTLRRSESGVWQGYLNEYDTKLTLVGSYEMPSYRLEVPSRHHGIVGYTAMENGDIAFTTSDGGLYTLHVFAAPANRLDYRGPMHPSGKGYVASLFTIDGRGLVLGFNKIHGKNKYELIIYELLTQAVATYPLDTSHLRGLLLYGTATRDDTGSFYLVGHGRRLEESASRPLLLEIPVASLWEHASATDPH